MRRRSRGAFETTLAWAGVAWLLAAMACGKDVDLGGTPDDGGTPVDGGVVGFCEPCTSSSECGPRAACAGLGGAEGFCLATCSGSSCGNAETCTSLPVVSGGNATVCSPRTGRCAGPAPPTVDGAAVERCGNDVAPTVPAACHACERTSKSCQLNGCYGGYWCDTTTRRCERPPATCR